MVKTLYLKLKIPYCRESKLAGHREKSVFKNFILSDSVAYKADSSGANRILFISEMFIDMNVIAVSACFQEHVIILKLYFIHLSPKIKCQIANRIGNAMVILTFTPNKFWVEIANRIIIKGVIKPQKINKFFPNIKLSTFK